MPGPPVRHDASEYSPADAAEYVNETFVDNYMLYATTAMLVYELLTTFDEEVERVWSLKWRLPKLLFMLNRYIVRGLLILQLIAGNYPGTSPRFCQIYGYWQIIPPRLAIIVAQAIMVIRLWAIYNNSRKMLLFLVVVYTAEVVAIVTCSVLAVRYTQGVAQPPPLSCGLEALNPDLRQYASATWIAPVGFELIVVVLTVVKLFPPLPPQFKFLDKINLSVLRSLSIATPARNPTLDLLARDSLIYFAFTFTFTLANAVIYETSFAKHYRAILLAPTAAISCIAVSRMIINIRSLPDPDLSTSTGYFQESTNLASSDVVFAAHGPYRDYDDGRIAEVRRVSVSQPFRGRVTGKEREGEASDEFELIHTPRSFGRNFIL